MTKTNQTDYRLPSPYLTFSRERWSEYRLDTPLPLSPEDVQKLSGQTDVVSVEEVEKIYLPLSRLLSLYVSATQGLHRVSGDFLGVSEPKVPYIIGVSGSVAVGKSTTSRVLKALLSHWHNHPKVEIITTDGFLYPNQKLQDLGLMERKGFPESYDTEHLLRVLHQIKSGQEQVSVPIYSHHKYDIQSNETQKIEKPDIVIVEGLNILQTRARNIHEMQRLFVSDFFDFSLFVDAKPQIIQDWYVNRVLTFWAGPFQQEDSYFHFLTKLNQEEVTKFALRIWREINEVNLMENILPFKKRAHLILQKDKDHRVIEVNLRKL